MAKTRGCNRRTCKTGSAVSRGQRGGPREYIAGSLAGRKRAGWHCGPASLRLIPAAQYGTIWKNYTPECKVSYESLSIYSILRVIQIRGLRTLLVCLSSHKQRALRSPRYSQRRKTRVEISSHFFSLSNTADEKEQRNYFKGFQLANHISHFLIAIRSTNRFYFACSTMPITAAALV